MLHKLNRRVHTLEATYSDQRYASQKVDIGPLIQRLLDHPDGLDICRRFVQALREGEDERACAIWAEAEPLIAAQEAGAGVDS